MTYTLQIDGHGNMIVCKGDQVRSGYRIVRAASYAECCHARDYFAACPRERRNYFAIDQHRAAAMTGGAA